MYGHHPGDTHQHRRDGMLFGSGSVLRPVRLSLGELSNTRGQVISCAPNDTDTGSQSQVLCATNTTVGIFLAIHGERCQYSHWAKVGGRLLEDITL